MKKLLLAAALVLSTPVLAADWWWFNEFSKDCAPQDVTEAYNAAVSVWKDEKEASQTGWTTAPPARNAKPVLRVVNPNQKEIVTGNDVERLYRTREACQSATSATQKK
jgi:hypothetical protein